MNSETERVYRALQQSYLTEAPARLVELRKEAEAFRAGRARGDRVAAHAAAPAGRRGCSARAAGCLRSGARTGELARGEPVPSGREQREAARRPQRAECRIRPAGRALDPGCRDAAAGGVRMAGTGGRGAGPAARAHGPRALVGELRRARGRPGRAGYHVAVDPARPRGRLRRPIRSIDPYAMTAAWTSSRLARPRAVVVIEAGGTDRPHARRRRPGADQIFIAEQVDSELPRFARLMARIGAPPARVRDRGCRPGGRRVRRLPHAGRRPGGAGPRRRTRHRTSSTRRCPTSCCSPRSCPTPMASPSRACSARIRAFTWCRSCSSAPARRHRRPDRGAPGGRRRLPRAPGGRVAAPAAGGVTRRAWTPAARAGASRRPHRACSTTRRCSPSSRSRWILRRRSGSGFALLIVDVDHFRRVNDRFGHLVGDQVLVHVGGLLRSHVRASDLVGRYGGEEFGLILRGCRHRGRGASLPASCSRSLRRSRPRRATAASSRSR